MLQDIRAFSSQSDGGVTVFPPRLWRLTPGYSRRGNRSPRLCFKTVLASFPAHGSSIVWCLSSIPTTVLSRLCIMAVSVQQLPVVIGIFPALGFREDVVDFQQVSCLAV
jgi:hypothetical protein